MKLFSKNIILIVALFSAGKLFAGESDTSNISYSDFTAKQQCFNSSDGIMKYIDEGEGKPILLLHGVPTSGWLYRKMIPELSTNGYRVIVPDMLGFGNSANPEGKNIYSPENHAKRLLELMNRLDIDSWTLVAHDAASIWTRELLNLDSNIVNKLVFMNAVLTNESINWKDQIEMGLTAKIGLGMQRIGLKKGSFVTKFLVNNLVNTELSQSEFSGYESAIRAGKTDAIFAHYSQMLQISKSENNRLPKFSGPVSIIWGKMDEGLNWKTQAEQIKMRYNLNESSINLLETGHFVPEEKPQEAASFIMNFIDPK